MYLISTSFDIKLVMRQNPHHTIHLRSFSVPCVLGSEFVVHPSHYPASRPSHHPSLLPRPSSNSFRSASVVPEDLAERLHSAGAQRMTFRQLVPPETSSRLQAAASFSHLLQLHKQRKLRLQQQLAYGPLYICCVDE